MSDFISDFLEYSSGTECHENFLRWSALMPVAVAAGRRYFVMQGRLRRLPELCIMLIGPSGGKKTYAKDLAGEIVAEALPDVTIPADVTTRDDLVRLLASSETSRFYINHEGAECEWHPLALFIDEIRHFMSYSPSLMISFMVAVYGRKRFKSSLIKRGVEDAVEPCINLLACTTPDWIIEHLRSGILSGGWSRRFIPVYEPELTSRCISFPAEPPNKALLRARMRARLESIEKHAGEFKWDDDATAFFDAWYVANKKQLPDDPHLQAYFLTKDMHVVTNAMLIDLAKETPTLRITRRNLVESLSFFTVIETNLPKLYLAAGRNELAIPQQKLLDLLERNNGGMSKIDLMARTDKDFNPIEQLSVLRHLSDIAKIFIKAVEMPDKRKIEMVMLPGKWQEVLENSGKWRDGK